ncbi:MAG: deoxyguanosinetriphosphate triphosphohydrolase [Pseudomonadota bacterium]
MIAKPLPRRTAIAAPDEPRTTGLQTGAPLPASHEGRAPYAEDPRRSRGRLLSEAGCATRAHFQRDRDRIIHSSAFRRLNYKTQVFVYHEGDHYRSRLTHTLEVAQIARAIARVLRADEDLAEAVALAHDLGHPPFGHAGEQALDRAMAPHGGFDHNAQSLRVVTQLEERYAGHDGLNLTWETLEGIAKHSGPFLPGGKQWPPHWSIAAYTAAHDLELATFPSLEAQIAAAADDIAWLNHDLDDALRAGLLTTDMLADQPLVAGFLADVRVQHGDVADQRLVYEINRRLITALVMDAIAHIQGELAAHGIDHPDDVRLAGQWLVGFSSQMTERLGELRRFLFANVYHQDRVKRVMTDAADMLEELFHAFLSGDAQVGADWRARLEAAHDDTARARHVCDYVAGMTDRYAIQQHRRWFSSTPELV